MKRFLVISLSALTGCTAFVAVATAPHHNNPNSQGPAPLSAEVQRASAEQQLERYSQLLEAIDQRDVDTIIDQKDGSL